LIDEGPAAIEHRPAGFIDENECATAMNMPSQI
jgi:hypothetical protein